MSSQTNTQYKCNRNLHFVGQYASGIKSYARKMGRMSVHQKNQLYDLEQYLISPESLVEIGSYHLDIGFGMGSSLLEYSEQNPELCCVGIDVYLPGLLSVFGATKEKGLANVNLINGDAKSVVSQLPKGKAASIFVLFPDPWPKKKQQKRRLLQISFLTQLCELLDVSGSLFIATDCDQYASHIDEAISALHGIVVESGIDLPINATKYQKRAERLGHTIFTWCLSHYPD